MSTQKYAQKNTPGFFKRLLIVVYDGFLLAGILFVASIVFLFIPDSFEFSLAGKIIKSLYLLCVSFFFYGWFWTHGGQTLGMRAWNLYLVQADGKFINWPRAALRYVAAILSWAIVGVGFTTILLNKSNRAWHDVISGSQIVFVPKDEQKKIKK